MGILKSHAKTAHNTIATSPAHNTINALDGLSPKFAILYKVYTTVELISVITSTPKKLNSAAIAITLLGLIALIDTHVAIALRASVHPFTRITPKIKIVITTSVGFFNNCEK